MPSRFVLSILFVLLIAGPVAAQNGSGGFMPATSSTGPYRAAPKPYQILGMSVEGVQEESMKNFVLQASGLATGQQVTIPGGKEIADAIRNVYRLRVFSDVKIVEERKVGDGIYLAIVVKEEPQLADYSFSGMKKKAREEIQKQIPLFKGARIRPADLERSKQLILDYYRDKGYMLASVDVQREETAQNTVNIEFAVDKGARVEVKDIEFVGNEEVDGTKLRKRMKETKQDTWWRFWSRATFDRKEYEEDLAKVIEYYNQRGFYDARIVRDSVYLRSEGENPEAVIQVEVHEGPRYFVRDITWEGNTLYSDEVLTQSLGLEKGDAFNTTRMEQNLYANKRSSDISSLYMNRGYMRFNVQPQVAVVDGDSVDMHFDIFEGDVYQFGNITIAGNTKTKDHVIRRELITIPGNTFSREAIMESVRRLSQMKYFDQEKLGAGPGVAIDEERQRVDLNYSFEEVGSDQLELSGTYGRFGLVLMLSFNFNNFSIQDVFRKGSWKPLPSGDGQRLSVSLQTNGLAYQNYSLGFTEPWFKGKPTPVGFNVSHTRFQGNNIYSQINTGPGSKYIRTSTSVFYQQRLKWPDDLFNSSTSLGYEFFVNDGITLTLPEGNSHKLSLRQSISRSSIDNPLFPSRGSAHELSLELAPPIANFIHFHKWRFKTSWNVPFRQGLSLNFAGNFGYIGSFTGDDPEFDRFVVGGSPFDAQGFTNTFGKEIVFARAYPARSIGPRRLGEPTGGRILNKYSTELRWLAVQSQQLQALPYLFLEASNTWDGFDTYNPAQLFRAGGVGARLFLPILGMIELVYGYNFDEFDPIPGLSGSHNGSRRWTFQFTIGTTFGE